MRSFPSDGGSHLKAPCIERVVSGQSPKSTRTFGFAPEQAFGCNPKSTLHPARSELRQTSVNGGALVGRRSTQPEEGKPPSN